MSEGKQQPGGRSDDGIFGLNRRKAIVTVVAALVLVGSAIALPILPAAAFLPRLKRLAEELPQTELEQRPEHDEPRGSPESAAREASP